MIFDKIKKLREDHRFAAIVVALESAYKRDNITSRYSIPAIETELEFNEWKVNNSDNEDLIQGEVEIKSSEEMPMASDAINILDIFGIYSNHYRTNINDILQKSGSVIDYTGKFSKTDLYVNTLSKALTLLSTVYEKDPHMRKINELCNLLCDKSAMIKAMGTKEAPFAYEGLQLLFYTNILIALALIPNRLRNLNNGIHELVNECTNEGVKTILQITDDVLGMKSKIGNSIIYIDAPKSEITKRAEDKITGSIYQTSSVLSKIDNNGNLTLAGESIENMLVIKNNGAIVEASLLFKGLAVVAGLMKGLNISELLSTTYSSIVEILGSKDINNADDMVTSKENECKIKLFLPIQENFNKLDLSYQDETNEDAIVKSEDDIEPKEGNNDDQSPKITDFDVDDSDWGL